MTDLRALHTALPIFTSVKIKGNLEFVVAILNSTVTSTFPARKLFTALMMEISGLDGFSFAETANAVDDAERQTNPPIIKLDVIL